MSVSRHTSEVDRYQRTKNTALLDPTTDGIPAGTGTLFFTLLFFY